MGKLISINPSTYETIGEVESTPIERISQMVKEAHAAKQEWQQMGVANRVALMRGVFAEFAANKQEFSELEAREMGMPVSEALGSFDASMDYANWYFDNAEKYLAPETTFESDTELHQVFFEPLGVSAVIVPWNFPLDNFVWGVIQNLLCGNTMVFKHSEEVPLCAQFIEKVMNSRNLPKGVFSVVYGAADEGWSLVNDNINAIGFTGSTKVGKMLYKLAGEKFVKAVMELGGSAPGVVFEDADMDIAVENICANRLACQGQACDGLKRAIVHESRVEEFVEKMKAVFESKIVGNAEDPKTQVGPLAAKRQLDLLEAQVNDAVALGAQVVTGGVTLEKELGGAFYKPTLLRNVSSKMRVWQEEVFGPVLPIVTFKTEEEAIALANDTQYGLGSYVHTADKDRAMRVAGAIQSGMVSINATNYLVPFDPFGGYKSSGFGREHGKYGFHELTQIKVVAKPK